MKLLKSWYLWFTLGILAILVGSGIGYRVYSAHTYNEIVSSVQNQELHGTNEYITISNLNTDIAIGGASQSASGAQLSALQNDVNTIKQLAATSCRDQTSDITSTNLDNKIKHLWLNGSQKKYISDAKTVLKDLSTSAHSNEGICKYGGVFIGTDENYIQQLPGMVTVAQLQNNPSAPSAQQIHTLQKYTTAQVADYQELERSVPDIAAFMSYRNTLLANIYYELTAVEAGNMSEATRYAAIVDQLESMFSTTSSKSAAAGVAYDTRLNTASIDAAKAEISLIDAQGHGNGSDTKLDYAVPAFWMLDAKIGLYSDASKNNLPPSARSIQQLITALHDGDLTALDNKGLLQNASYTCLGSNNSGFELTVKLASGNTLNEKEPPRQ